MNSPQSIIRYLYGLQHFGIKLGLRNIKQLLRDLGNPHRAYHTVHIAGTNGKGSTSSLIASVLTAAGYRVGLYTSPHLVRFNERIRINGRMISNHDLIRYTQMLRSRIDSLSATFFEVTTAVAFKYFAEKNVDIAIIETGLGGRLDATNIIHPLVSVITSIGYDHREHLGRSYEMIAYEKGGIIKRKVPVVVGQLPPAALKEIRSIARARSSHLINSGHIGVRVRATTNSNQLVIARANHQRCWTTKLPLAGTHQIRNLQCALSALMEVEQHGYLLPSASVERGIEEVAIFSGLRGRLEVLRQSPRILLDVAHNIDGIRSLIRYVGGLGYRRVHLVFGIMKDKEYEKIIPVLAKINPIMYAVSPMMERALPAPVLCTKLRAHGLRASAYASTIDGIRAALVSQREQDLLLITGSHYVAGEALQYLKTQKIA